MGRGFLVMRWFGRCSLCIRLPQKVSKVLSSLGRLVSEAFDVQAAPMTKGIINQVRVRII